MQARVHERDFRICTFLYGNVGVTNAQQTTYKSTRALVRSSVHRMSHEFLFFRAMSKEFPDGGEKDKECYCRADQNNDHQKSITLTKGSRS